MASRLANEYSDVARATIGLLFRAHCHRRVASNSVRTSMEKKPMCCGSPPKQKQKRFEIVHAEPLCDGID
jgi:hypothetical protein